MRKNVGSRAAAMLLSVLVAMTSVPLPAQADAQTGPDTSCAVLAGGRTVNAALKGLAGDTVPDPSKAGSVSDRKITGIRLSSTAPDAEEQTVNIAAQGSPDVYAWFVPSGTLPHTGSAPSDAEGGADAAAVEAAPAAETQEAAPAETPAPTEAPAEEAAPAETAPSEEQQAASQPAADRTESQPAAVSEPSGTVVVTPEEETTAASSAQEAAQAASSADSAASASSAAAAEEDPDAKGVICVYTSAPSIAYGTDAVSMFEGMTVLNSLNGLSSFDFSKVSDASRMFYGDAVLSDITPIAEYDGSSVTKADRTFEGTKVNASAVPAWYVKANTVTSDETDSETAQAVSEASAAGSTADPSAESVESVAESAASSASETVSTAETEAGSTESAAESAVSSGAVSTAESAAESTAESGLSDEDKTVAERLYNYFANYSDGGASWDITAEFVTTEPQDTYRENTAPVELYVPAPGQDGTDSAAEPAADTAADSAAEPAVDAAADNTAESAASALPKTGRKGTLPKTDISWVKLYARDGQERYGTWSTGYYKVQASDGNTYLSICMNPSFKAPARVETYSGGRLTEILNATARKVLYYGEGGQGDLGYGLAATHLALSKAMGSGDWAYRADSGTISRANAMLKRLSSFPDVPSGVKAYKITTYGSHKQNLLFIEKVHTSTAYVTKRSANSRQSNTDRYSLAGAIYEILDKNNKVVDILKTTKGGNSNKVELYPGTYTIKEKQASKGFRLNTEVKTFTVANDGSTIHITFDEPLYRHGSLKIRKVASAWNTDLSGASFRLDEWSAKRNQFVTSGYKLNATGSSSWKSDELYETDDNQGRFRVVETGVPTHAFGLNGTYEFNVTQSTSRTFTVPNDTENVIRIVKTDPYDTSVRLAGAEFSVQQYNSAAGRYEDYKKITAANYNASTGVYSIPVRNTAQNRGMYRITETKAPDGYQPNFTRDITVRANSPYELEVMNAFNISLFPKGRIEIAKTDTSTGASITDEEALTAEFDVYEWQGQTSQYRKVGVLTWDSKAKKFVSGDLPIRIKADHPTRTASSTLNWNEGKYRVVEKTAPLGFVNSGWAKEFTFTTKDLNQTEVLSDAVSNTPNEYKIYKVSAKDGKPVNAVFRLAASGKDKTVYVNGTKTTVTAAGVEVSTRDGVITLSRIEAGAYTYTEVAVDAPYIVEKAASGAFSVNASGLVSDADEKAKGQASATLENSPAVELYIEKKSAEQDVVENGFPAGTEFRIEEYSAALKGYRYYATAAYGQKDGSDTGAFLDKTTKKPVMLTWTKSNQGRYRVAEIAATPGYVLDSTPKEVTLPDTITENTPPVSVSFVNKPNGFFIHKQDTTGLELENCGFEIWNTDNRSLYDKTVMTTIKNASGTGDETKAMAAFRALPAGSYAYREVSAPNGYKVDPKTYTFKVSSAGMLTGQDGKETDTLTVTVKDPQLTKFRLVKTDDKGRTYGKNGFPAGTVFAVYEWSEAAQAYSTVPVRYITYITDEDKTAGTHPVITDATKQRAGGSLPKTGRGGMLPKTGVKDSAEYNFTYGWNDGTYMYLNVRNKSTGAVVKNVSIYVGAHIDANHKFSTGAWTHDGITWYYRIANSKINVRKVSGVNLYSDAVYTDASTRVPNRWEANSGFGCFASYKVYFEDESGKRIKTVTKNLGDYIVTGAPSLTKTGYALTWKKLSTDGTYSAVQATPPGTTPEERSSRGTSTNYLAAHDEGTNKASEEQRNPYLHVKAFWTANTYHVHFDANGGSGSMGDQIMTYDTAANLTANAFTRNGYTFNGWNTQANGKGTSYANMASVRNLTSTANGTVTLYAQWNLIKYTVTVKYDANGGTGSADQQTFTSYGTDDGNKSIGAFHTGTISRPGYTLAGWQVDGTGDTYTPDNAVKASWVHGHNGQTVTLKAQWTPKTYTIVYDGNGADGGHMDNQTVQYDDTLTLKSGYTRTGYTFVDWLDGYGDHRSAGTSVTVKELADKWMIPNHTDTFSFWAQWKPNEYKLTFDLDGGKASGTMPSSYTYGMVTTIPQPTKNGYNFLGWTSKALGYTDPVENAVVLETQTGDVDLTANWAKAGSFVDPDTLKDPEMTVTADNKGKFRVREVAATEGYLLDQSYKDVDLLRHTYTENGNTTENKLSKTADGSMDQVPFTNKPNQYTIRKVDMSGSPVADVHFTVTDPSGKAQEYVTGKDGLISFTALVSGTWTYKESQAPDGYVLDPHTYSIVVSSPDHRVNGQEAADETIYNPDRKPKSFIIKKVDENGRAIPDVHFIVTNTKGETADVYTRNDGQYQVIPKKDELNGTYKVQEATWEEQNKFQKNHPGQILKIDPTVYTVTMKDGVFVPEEVVLTIRNETNHFVLKKVSEDGKTLIPGASFRIWNDRTDAGAYDQTLTTDEKGEIRVDSLVTGTWHYEETGAPDGYRLDPKRHDFTVDENGRVSGQWTYTVTVKEIPMTFTLKKTGADGKALAGASFHIWNDRTDTGAYDKTLTTGADGTIAVRGLMPGAYHYQETAAPAGYLVDHAVRNVTLEAGKDASVTAADRQNRFTVRKTDKNGKAIAGAEFGFTFTPAANGTTASVVTATSSVKTTEDGTKLYLWKAGADGTVVFNGLAAGTYTYRETAAPNGYKVNPDVYTMTVSDDGTVHAAALADGADPSGLATKAGEGDANLEASVSDLEQLSFTPVVKKKDAETGKALSGAVFELDVADGTGWKKVSTSAWNADRELYTFPIVSSGDGGTQYRIVEIQAPDGYVCDYSRVFTPDEAAAFEVPYEFDADNTPNQVTLRKTDEDGNVLAQFDGFNVAMQGNADWTYAGQRFVKAVNGEAVLERLAAGTYTYSEDWDHIPEGFLPDTDETGTMRVHTFTVAKDGSIIQSDGTPASRAAFTLKDRPETTGTIKLHKTDRDGKDMTGAAFAVYAWSRAKGAYASDPVGTLSYNETDKLYTSGPLSITADNLGRFRIVETASGKDAYPAGRTADVVFAEGETEKTVTMVDQPNQLPVRKTDGAGKALAGAVFTLEDKAYYESGEKAHADGKDAEPFAATATSGSDGIARFLAIPTGTYVLYESAGVPGYAVDTAVHEVVVDEAYNITVDGKAVQVADSGAVTVGGKASGNAALTVVNRENRLTVRKTDPDKKPYAGVSFKLVRYADPLYDTELKDGTSGTAPAAQETRTGTTGTDGTVSWNRLADGYWYLEETAVPQGVTLCTEKRMILVRNGLLSLGYGEDSQVELTYTIWDGTPFEGHLYLKKVDKDTKEVLKDAVFSVYEWNTVAQDPLIDRKDPVAVMKYNAVHDRYETWKQESGKDVWDTALPITDENQALFMVVETKAPAGHAAEDLFRKVNLYDQRTQTITIENPKMGRLIIEKYDEDTYTEDSFDDAVKLDGAQFSFWKDGDEAHAKTYTTGEGETGGKHDAEHHGRIIITGLEAGATYHYRETKAPAGYSCDTSVRTITVTGYGWINGEKGDVVVRVADKKMNPITLHTGGTGRTLLYIGGAALLGLFGALAGIRKAKARKAEAAADASADTEAEDKDQKE